MKVKESSNLDELFTYIWASFAGYVMMMPRSFSGYPPRTNYSHPKLVYVPAEQD